MVEVHKSLINGKDWSIVRSVWFGFSSVGCLFFLGFTDF